jgi:hypothetical protein
MAYRRPDANAHTLSWVPNPVLYLTHSKRRRDMPTWAIVAIVLAVILVVLLIVRFTVQK